MVPSVAGAFRRRVVGGTLRRRPDHMSALRGQEAPVGGASLAVATGVTLDGKVRDQLGERLPTALADQFGGDP